MHKKLKCKKLNAKYFQLYPAGFGNGMTYISPMMFNESSIQRRQTARESTGPLKGWLQEHPRNPYPTKAEKVMLALISGMKIWPELTSYDKLLKFYCILTLKFVLRLIF